MRLRFSRTSDYGLRAALEIARAPAGDLIPRHAIARAIDAPAGVLAQALAPLVRSGVLAAQAGPRGGYRLARPAEQISIHDIVVAIDGPPEVQRCVLRETACSRESPCPFHTFLVAAQERFFDTLRTTSLATVIAAGELPSGLPAAAGAR
jgi:Rrf2 family protein